MRSLRNTITLPIHVLIISAFISAPFQAFAFDPSLSEFTASSLATPHESLIQSREVLVQLRAGNRETLTSRIEEFRKKSALLFGREYASSDASVQAASDSSFIRMRVPHGMDTGRFIATLRATGDTDIIEPNAPVTALTVPNDTYYDTYQWNLKLTQAEQAWDQATGEGIIVAVLDSGIAYESYSSYTRAPDFNATTFAQGYDIINRDTHANDDFGHGTHIAGIIAASMNDRYGIAGIAPKATLMPIKVLDRNGNGTIADLAEGIRWAADHGAQVINMSVGSTESSEILKQALAYAYGKGVVLVAAAGNDGTHGLMYPAAEKDYVISVGAADASGNRAPYSNMGDSLDVIAPGGLISEDRNGDGYPDGVLSLSFQRIGSFTNTRRYTYVFAQGTSVAAPHVAGVAAMVMSLGVKNPAQVRALIRESATDLGATGYDTAYGAGLLNAAQAVAQAKGVLPVDQIATTNQTTITRSTSVDEQNEPPSPTSPVSDTTNEQTNQDNGSANPSTGTSPSTNESPAGATPVANTLSATISFIDRFNRSVSRFYWWDTVKVRVKVAQQDGSAVSGASVEMRYREQGGNDLGTVVGSTNAQGIAEFAIGPFSRNKIIEVGAVAIQGSAHSAMTAATFSIR